MRKKVRRIGTSIGFILNKEEQEAYNLKIGKIVDLSLKEVQEKC